MAAPKKRGSDKLVANLFGGAKISKSQLAKAVSSAQTSGLQIKRWWWYGQPQIDSIIASLDVAPSEVGATVESLTRLHSSAVQVGLEIFPNGIPVPDIIRINVTLNKNLKRPG